MQTQLIHDVSLAAEILRAGGLVAFPTETVFGLGADARSATAITALFRAKGRPSDNPLIIHVADITAWSLAARELTAPAKKILQAFSPGPVTVVLPKNPAICSAATAGLDSVGIRIPADPIARQLLEAAGIPIAAPSANRSGRPSCTTWQSVREDLDGQIDAILAHNVPHGGLESSVVDCTGEVPILLRPGAVTLEDLRTLFPSARQLQAEDAVHTVASPGVNHPHYQPRAQVVLFETAADLLGMQILPPAAYCGLQPPPGDLPFVVEETFPSLAAYAHGFYEFLRRSDRAGAGAIYVQLASGGGIATALRDRQSRAAGSEGVRSKE